MTLTKPLDLYSPSISQFIIGLLNYDSRLSKKPLLFRSFTGLELSEFDSICKEVESKYPKYEIKRLYLRMIEQEVCRCRETFQTFSNRQISHMLLVCTINYT